MIQLEAPKIYACTSGRGPNDKDDFGANDSRTDGRRAGRATANSFEERLQRDESCDPERVDFGGSNLFSTARAQKLKNK